MKSKSDFSVVLTWREDGPRGSFGPGVSRPRDGERTKPFTLRVMQGNALPMKVTLHASNKRTAIKYAKNRWPGAAVEAA